MLNHLLAEADPVYGYVVAGLMLALVIGLVAIACSLATDKDHFTDAEIDRLPSTLLHGPDVDPLPDWVREEIETRDDRRPPKLMPFSANATTTHNEDE